MGEFLVGTIVVTVILGIVWLFAKLVFGESKSTIGSSQAMLDLKLQEMKAKRDETTKKIIELGKEYEKKVKEMCEGKEEADNENSSSAGITIPVPSNKTGLFISLAYSGFALDDSILKKMHPKFNANKWMDEVGEKYINHYCTAAEMIIDEDVDVTKVKIYDIIKKFESYKPLQPHINLYESYATCVSWIKQACLENPKKTLKSVVESCDVVLTAFENGNMDSLPIAYFGKDITYSPVKGNDIEEKFSLDENPDKAVLSDLILKPDTVVYLPIIVVVNGIGLVANIRIRKTDEVDRTCLIK